MEFSKSQKKRIAEQKSITPERLADDKQDGNESAPYGYCPMCGHLGKSRERRINGNDKCINGHIYPSKDAIYSPS